MKSSLRFLITALLYAAAGICFIATAIAQTQTAPKVLAIVAAACFLIGGFGYFYSYLKSR